MSNFVLLPVVKNANQSPDTKDVVFNTAYVTYVEPAQKFNERSIVGVLGADNPFVVALSVEKVLAKITEK